MSELEINSLWIQTDLDMNLNPSAHYVPMAQFHNNFEMVIQMYSKMFHVYLKIYAIFIYLKIYFY